MNSSNDVPISGKRSFDEESISPSKFTFQEHSNLIEEKPLAARGAYQISGEDPSEEEDKEETGPLGKRVNSKSWKTRSRAYGEIANILRSGSSSAFSEFSSEIVKFISDSNPGAQEKALEIVGVYIKNQPEMLASQGEVLCKALVEKGMTHAKPSIKSDSTNLLLDFFSIHRENFEGFISGLLFCLNNKNIKVQAAGISAINSIISSFGIKKLSFKPFVVAMEKCAGASNQQVRAEALSFYKESYKWARDLIKPHVEKLKKPQQDELNKAFEEITEVPVPTRWLKHEEALAKTRPSEVKNIKGLDIYEMADAKDIFTKYNEKWVNSVLNMEKWVEKKQALEELNKEANYPKLVEKNAIELVTLAKRLINDSNLQVMLQAMKLVGLLAKGQRRYFEQYARQFFPLIIQKFKDKKTQVAQESHMTLDHLMFSLSCDLIQEDVKSALDDPNPMVKTNMCQWLEKYSEKVSLNEIKNLCKQIVTLCKKNTDDPYPEVRSSAFKMISFLLEKFPEAVTPLIKDLPQAKIKKIEEVENDLISESPTSLKRRNSVHKTENSSKLPAVRSNSMKRKVVEPILSQSASNPKSATADEEEIGACVTAEEAESIVLELIPESITSKMKQNPWKEKQIGLQNLQEWLQSNKDCLQKHHEAILRFIRVIVKEWKENNFNVAKAAIEIYQLVSENCNISKRAAAGVLSAGALEKLSDVKIVDAYLLCIYSLSEVIGPRFVVSLLIKNTTELCKPKIVSECCSCIEKIITDFGVHTVHIKDVIDYAKLGLNQANPVIKKAAQSLTLAIYKFMGEKLLPMLADVKESTLKMMNEEFSKTEVITTATFKAVKGEVALQVNPQKMLNDAIPRNNIEKLITPALLKKVSDPDWKVRKEGLEDVEGILESSHMRIQPSGLETLVKSLVSRLADPNKSLVRQTLALSAKFASALGQDSKIFARQLLPAIIICLADKQNLLRQDAMLTLNKWADEAGADIVIIYSAGPINTDNPELRSELLRWLLDHKALFKVVDMKPHIQGVLACLQDRSAQIRALAESMFSEVVEIVGFEAFQPYLKDIKPAVMNTLNLIFDKYKHEVESGASVSLPPRTPRPSTLSTTRSISKEVPAKRLSTIIPSDLDIKSPLRKTKSVANNIQDAGIITVGSKEKRLELESKNKWTIEDIRPDYQLKLKDQMKTCLSADLNNLLNNSDFKKQVEGVIQLTGIISSQKREAIDILDIIFRWIWIKLQENTNTQLIKAILEMIQCVLNILIEENYQLQDIEGALFFPMICEKTGQNNAQFQSLARSILHSSTKIYPPEKVFAFVLAGCSSKNTKSKVECLEEVAAIIHEFGIGICQAKDVKIIAKHASSQDNNVRTAAVQTMGEIYKFAGEKVWAMVGDIPDKIKDLFDQRFRTVAGGNSHTIARRGSARDSISKILSP